MRFSGGKMVHIDNAVCIVGAVLRGQLCDEREVSPQTLRLPNAESQRAVLELREL